LRRREGVDRVAGEDGVTQAGRLGVEAGRAVAAAEDGPGQVLVAQGEHAPVLLEGAAPGDDLVQPDGHLASPLPSGTAPAPPRRLAPGSCGVGTDLPVENARTSWYTTVVVKPINPGPAPAS